MKPILVTSGNIGNHVAEQLAAKGLPVRVLVRTGEQASPWAVDDIETVVGNLNATESLAQAFDGVGKFFSVSPFVENLVELGINSIEAAKRAGVEYIVRASAMGAGDESPVSVPRLHSQVEKALEQSGIPYTVVRPNGFMQNYLGQSQSIRAQSAFYLPQGEGKVSVVDVRDIAAVAVRALTERGHEDRKYTITGAEALSNQEIAEKFSVMLGREVKYVDVTDEQAAHSMRATGMGEWAIANLLDFLRAARQGSLASVAPDVEMVLKRKPVSFDDFLQDYRTVFDAAAASA